MDSNVGVRMPTVAEALAFSPFTSIVPFNPAIIPAPHAQPTVRNPAFAFETRDTRALLAKLGAGVVNAEQASERFKKTIRDVQKLLDPNCLPQFVFRRPQQRSDENITLSQRDALKQELSPFARLVLDDTHVPFRYQTPESPDVKPISQDTLDRATKALPERSDLPTPRSRVKTEVKFPNGNLIPLEPPQRTPESATDVTGPARVVIMNTLTPIEREQYQMMPDPDAHSNPCELSSFRRRDPKLLNGNRTISNDQRQKGDVAVSSLQSLLDTIFHAEDNLQADTSNTTVANQGAIFDIKESQTGRTPILQLHSQTNLDKQLLKVVKLDRIGDLDVDDLSRAQNFCQHAIEVTESSDLRVDGDWSEMDVIGWQTRLTSAERSIVAARTLLRITTAASHIKELQSEDQLRLILKSIKTVVQSCIVPLAEERSLSREKIRGEKSVPPPNPVFAIAASCRESLQSLVNVSTSALHVLENFLTKTHVDEMDLSSVETVCQALIFAENATSDKDSVIGSQRFEVLRRSAMDVLTQIFAKYPDQRRDILNTILISLGDLPATRQSARQYHLDDGKPIQLVSALLMRLVQTSALYSSDLPKDQSKAVADNDDDKDDDKDDAGEGAREKSSDSEGQSDEEATKDYRRSKHKQRHSRPQDLKSIATPLHQTVKSIAGHIAEHLVSRALITSKTGEDPYRRLLDIFTEDFLNVLGSTGWPAAEAILRALASRMLTIIKSAAKSTVPSRALALEMIGTIAAGVLQLRLSARSMAKSLGNSDSPVLRSLANLVEKNETEHLETSEVFASDGPYQAIVESLSARGLHDAQSRSARGCYLMQWAVGLSSAVKSSIVSYETSPGIITKDLDGKLHDMLVDPDRLEQTYDSPESLAAGKCAAMIVTLNSSLGKAFPIMYQNLLQQMSSGPPTIKSRSLKSVELILDTDASVLNQEAQIMSCIRKCMNDSSSLVRDSALLLVAKCTLLRSALDTSAYEMVVAQINDPAPTVKKRAIRLAKDMYLRNPSARMHSDIAAAIMVCVVDPEASIADLARQTMEEIWFTPLHRVKLEGDHGVEAKSKFEALAVLLIRIVEHLDRDTGVLETLLGQILSGSKLSQANAAVASTLVAVLSEAVIDSAHLEGPPSQQVVLRCLTVFVKADPKLFTATQLERLEPYTQNVAKDDGLGVFSSTVTILRYSLPHQTLIKPGVLETLRRSLLSMVPRLTPFKPELSEVFACVSTVDELLGSNENVAKWYVSVISGIINFRPVNLSAEPAAANKAARLIVIAGKAGRACNFNNQFGQFSERFPDRRFQTVQELIIDALSPFTSPKQPLTVRQEALEAICEVCQAWPKGFERRDVINAFEMAFRERGSVLEESVIAGLEEFFCAPDEKDGEEEGIRLGAGVATGAERLGRTYVAADKDRVSSHLSQIFFSTINDIALGSCRYAAGSAAKVVVSFISQSLVLPKDAPPNLIALETSPEPSIAKLAFAEHKIQHSKHESSWDREYMRAVQTVFDYQRNAVGHSPGYLGNPPIAKMHLLWDTLKGGKAQIRKKFLGNVAQKLAFNYDTVRTGDAEPLHLIFVRFCTDNLAFFDYDKVDDLSHLLIELEKTFSGSGTAVAQAVESEVLRPQDGSLSNADSLKIGATDDGSIFAAIPLDSTRLRQLAVSSQVCLLIWEVRTLLRRLWNMQKHKSKTSTAKDPVKGVAPTRAVNAGSLIESYIKRVNHIMDALTTPQKQYSICSDFFKTISVDSEVRGNAGSGDDDSVIMDALDGSETPSGESSGRSPSMQPSGGQRGKKRKAGGGSVGGSIGGTPRKKGGRRPSVGGRRKSGSTVATYVENHAEHDLA